MNALKNIATNWKTSFAGLLAGALQLYANGTGLKQIAVATAISVLGLLARDGSSTASIQQ